MVPDTNRQRDRECSAKRLPSRAGVLVVILPDFGRAVLEDASRLGLVGQHLGLQKWMLRKGTTTLVTNGLSLAAWRLVEAQSGAELKQRCPAEASPRLEERCCPRSL